MPAPEIENHVRNTIVAHEIAQLIAISNVNPDEQLLGHLQASLPHLPVTSAYTELIRRHEEPTRLTYINRLETSDAYQQKIFESKHAHAKAGVILDAVQAAPHEELAAVWKTLTAAFQETGNSLSNFLTETRTNFPSSRSLEEQLSYIESEFLSRVPRDSKYPWIKERYLKLFNLEAPRETIAVFSHPPILNLVMANVLDGSNQIHKKLLQHNPREWKKLTDKYIETKLSAQKTIFYTRLVNSPEMKIDAATQKALETKARLLQNPNIDSIQRSFILQALFRIKRLLTGSAMVNRSELQHVLKALFQPLSEDNLLVALQAV